MPAEGQQRAVSEPVRSLRRNRDYLSFMSGQFASYLATQVSQVALPLLVLMVTGSAVQAGLVGILRSAPYVLLSIPVGAMIDRWDRKLLMRICDSTRAVLYGGLIFVVVVERPALLVVIYLVAAVEGILFVFFDIAEIASIPQLVDESQLSVAGAQNIINYSMASLAGPVLAGFLYELAPAAPVIAPTGAYVVSVISLLSIRTRFQGVRSTAQRSVWHEIRDGMSWMRKNPTVPLLGFLLGGNYLFTAGIPLSLLLAAREHGVAAGVVGGVIAAGGAGSILGALIAPRIERFFRRGRLIATCLAGQAGLLALMAISSEVLLTGALFCCAGGLVAIFDVVQRTYRMRLIPEPLQGRVNSLYRLMLFGGAPLGISLAGVLLDAYGSALTVVVLAGGLAVTAAVALAAPRIRNL
jgi:MFS family permease